MLGVPQQSIPQVIAPPAESSIIDLTGPICVFNRSGCPLLRKAGMILKKDEDGIVFLTNNDWKLNDPFMIEGDEETSFETINSSCEKFIGIVSESIEALKVCENCPDRKREMPISVLKLKNETGNQGDEVLQIGISFKNRVINYGLNTTK